MDKLPSNTDSSSGLPGRERIETLAVGIEWATRISTIGLEFALPPLLGFGTDSWLGTTPAATITGAVLGFVLGMWQTLRLARQVPGDSSRTASTSRDLRRP